jgi:hypothetical protein
MELSLSAVTTQSRWLSPRTNCFQRECRTGVDMPKTTRRDETLELQNVGPINHPLGNATGSHYKHSWTAKRGGGLDSTCTKCCSLVASNMDELSLLVIEHLHICGR